MIVLHSCDECLCILMICWWALKVLEVIHMYLQRRRWHPTPVLLPGKSHGRRSPVGCSPWGCSESDRTERLHLHALEKEMATYSSILAWRIPGTGEPGGLPSMGSHRVGHDWSDIAAVAAHVFMYDLNQIACFWNKIYSLI